jgi:ABC-type transport system involved in multi-copper enzyme maturation permease subunit
MTEGPAPTPTPTPEPAPRPAIAIAAPIPASLRRGGFLDNIRAAFRYDFPGPVFQKEILASQRKFAAFGSRMMYVLILGGILWIVYAATKSQADYGYSPVRTLQSLQAVAPSLTAAVLWVQASLLTLLAPGMTSSAFSEERRKRTLDVLLTSPIRPWQIVLGKLLSGVAALGVISLCALPVLLAVRVFGGVEAEYIFGAFALSLSLGTLMASLAMLSSLWCKKSSTAAFLAFIFFCIIHGLPLLIGGTLASIILVGGPPTGWLETLFTVSAPVSLMSLMSGMIGLPGFPFNPTQAWIAGTLYNLAITGIIFFFCTTVLRRVMLSLASGDSPSTIAVGRVTITRTLPLTPGASNRTDPTTAASGIAGMIDSSSESEDREQPLTKSKKRPIAGRKTSRAVADHPVLWREMAQPLFKRPVVGILSIIALTAFTLWVFAMSRIGGGRDHEAHLYITNMVFAVVMLLQASTLTVAGFPAEREAKTWDVLLCSPLSSRALIIGKFAGALRSLWLLPAALLLNLTLLGVIAGVVAPLVVLHAILIFTGPLIFLAALGTRFSLAAKSSNGAGMRTTGIAVGLWGGTLIIGGICWLLLDAYNLGQSIWKDLVNRCMDVAFFVNPIYNFANALQGDTVNRYNAGDYTLGSPESRITVNAATFTLAMLGNLALYLAAAGLILKWSAAVFPKKSGRTS